jgi:hypothetical protein
MHLVEGSTQAHSRVLKTRNSDASDFATLAFPGYLTDPFAHQRRTIDAPFPSNHNVGSG